MTGRLDGEVAIVSGAARGQGEAIARRFVAEGARVVLGDVLPEVDAVAASLGAAAIAVRLDVRELAQWEAAVAAAEAAFGPVTVLVNNAGILRFGPLATTSLADYLDVVEVNEVGCYLGMRAVTPSMRTAGRGSIVNTSSINGLAGYPGTIAYTASKWAIRGLTKVAALELGGFGIRVNSIHPGSVDTEMVRPGAAAGLPPTDEQAASYAALPLGRQGRPDEVASMALFLASSESSYSTGSEFVLDGGRLAGPSM
jgi:3alpha(or 20beta)-hydroxysteroid dehydrogenase